MTVPRVTLLRPSLRFAAFTSHGLTVSPDSSWLVANATAASRSASEAFGWVSRCSSRRARRTLGVIGARSLRSVAGVDDGDPDMARTADCSSVLFEVTPCRDVGGG